MRVLLIIKGLAVTGGGAERVFTQLAGGLHARGHEVQVATFDAPGAPSYYPLPEAIPRFGLDISPIGKPTRRSALPRGMWALRRHVLRARPDVVVAFMHSTYVPVALALMGSGVPVVASEHIDAAHFSARPVQRRAVQFALRFCTLKTVPTAAIKAEQPAGMAAMTHVMENPVDLATFTPQAPEAAGPVILSAGRLMAQKDFPTLIEAFSRIAPDFPDWSLRIVGEGPLRTELEGMIATSPYADRISLPGMARNMVREYAGAGIFVLPSRYESFGLVTAEALACGRPVIGFGDCLGTAMLIEDGKNGLLIEPDNDRAAALAEGLRRLMRDDALRARKAQAGPASVARFSPDHILAGWETMLAELISAKTGPQGRLKREGIVS